MPTMIGSNEIGGGFVRLRFMDGTTTMKPGTPLTAEQIKSWPNGRRLIQTGHIAVYPPSLASHESAARGIVSHERHVVSRGFGHWDVIEGRKVNDHALTKDEAEALAAVTH